MPDHEQADPDHGRHRLYRRPARPAAPGAGLSGPLPGPRPAEALGPGVGRGPPGRDRPGRRPRPRLGPLGHGGVRGGVLPGPLDARGRAGLREAATAWPPRTSPAAAEEAGLGRIIYLGGLGHRSEKLSPHLESRHEVGDVLRAGKVPVTELRAAMIVGSGSASFEMLRSLVHKLPLMICPKWVETRTQPIADPRRPGLPDRLPREPRDRRPGPSTSAGPTS